ncbi:DUF2490 domain-containing protein [Hymenobacter sp. BT175]|uniref:DUF2490 domain-containing protein n=1 Tax=Hymenobacter translucens TaxID=2886507 RepID=UPI001D0E54ED|nr:DUF2490 domain-containing protein [Hymenobacter translucens]MCC2548502.1 DUF2490 domain-containing protein [Hymenobacter translucens]
MSRPLLLAGLFLLSTRAGFGQTPRLTDHNTLGWFVYAGDHQVTRKWAVHTEYQARRVNWLKAPQNQLARLGLVRTLSKRVQASGGYTYFQTHRYGRYPTVTSEAAPEQRLYEDLTLQDEPLGRLTLTHRLRLEQRWLGSRGEDGRGRVLDWEYQHRIRYQLAGEWALQGPTVDDGEWYLNAFDELFIGFGQNVGANVFNQNRLSGGLGYRFKEHAKVELNYLYQISQHATPDPATNRPVFEHNQGFRLNVLYNLDFSSE